MGAPGGYPPPHEHSEHSDTGKLFAAGAAGLALGAVGGAIAEHEWGRLHLPFGMYLC